MHGTATCLPSIQTFAFSIYPQYQLSHVFRQRGHVVIPFVPGFDTIAGKVLKLDHITDPNLRPLDELFRDHFLQCVLKNMKGVGEPVWDFEEALGDDIIDLGRSDIWGGKLGQGHLEFEMAHRLRAGQCSKGD
jgi:hypothetical protein